MHTTAVRADAEIVDVVAVASSFEVYIRNNHH